MVEDRSARRLSEALGAAGARWRLVPIDRLRELEAELAARRASGELNRTFDREWLSRFSFLLPQHERPAAAVLILAIRQPQVRIRFAYCGKERSLMLPPTYLTGIDGEMLNLVRRAIDPWGHWVIQAVLPLKLLAARSGLARYGRNNITYVEGFGSYYKLLAFVTDLAPLDDGWTSPQLLERCARCRRCEEACRMDAIGSDRFLLHAERCLTYYNDRAGEFPAWIDPSVHHCIMGCMFCQRACPENDGLLTTVELTEPFGENEIADIREGTPKDRLDPPTVDKLTKLDLYGDYEVFGRNLRAILDRPVRRRSSQLNGGKRKAES